MTIMANQFCICIVFILILCGVNGFIPYKYLQLAARDLGFSWSNCGSASEPLQFKSLTITPDPIHVPGNVTVSFSVAISSALPTDLHSSTNLQKKVSGFWVKVPCEHDVGSCSYNDLCSKWAVDCPKYFAKFGFPCTCPIPANTYTVTNAIVDISEKLPSKAEGEFKLNVNIGGGSGNIGCIELHFSLKN